MKRGVASLALISKSTLNVKPSGATDKSTTAPLEFILALAISTCISRYLPGGRKLSDRKICLWITCSESMERTCARIGCRLPSARSASIAVKSIAIENGVLEGPLRKSTRVPSPGGRGVLTTGGGRLQADTVSRTSMSTPSIGRSVWVSVERLAQRAWGVVRNCLMRDVMPNVMIYSLVGGLYK